jgi:hypothetical protein
MAELLAAAAALGVWLFGPKGDVISGAVKEPSLDRRCVGERAYKCIAGSMRS